MAFHHRKLMTTDEVENCRPFCDPEINTEGYCPVSCIAKCFRICIIPPPPDPFLTAHRDHASKIQNLHFHLIVTLSLLSAICFVFSCLAYYKYYKNRADSRRRSPDPQQQEETRDEFLDEDLGPTVDHPIWYIRTIGLQPSTINSITVCKYKRGDGLVEGTDCSVCLSEFQEDETLRLLPKCNHAFHIPCIDTWLRSHTNCPLCRAGIVASGSQLPAPTPEQSPAIREGEAQVEIPVRETEDLDSELRMGPEVGNGNGENSCAISKELVIGSDNLRVDEIQPMRRSVSMDSISASMLSAAIANANLRESAAGNPDLELAKSTGSSTSIVPKRVEGNPSVLRFVGCSSMKRSLSCSGKVLLSRNSRGRNLPSGRC